MKEEFKDGPQQGKRKFDQATKVLKTIIGQLEGTDEVGVANFGNQKVAFKPGQNWDADFQMRAPINPNVVKQQDACIKSLDDLVPEGVHTIALGAMRQGVEVLNQHSDDPGVLVLITDGAAQDNDANAWKAFAKKRGKHQAFIVAYAVDVNSPEMMALKKAAELNQVKFLAAPEPKELTSAIEDALTRREYFVLESNQPDRTAPLGEVVDGLTPGLYKVRFDDKEFQLELNPGQHSLLNVAWKDKEFVYNRPLEIHPTRVSLVEPPAGHMPGAPTMVSVTRFARDPQGKVQLTMAFENNDPEKGVQPPKEWLFAVFSGGKSVSANATVQSTKGSKVPAYTVEFDKWDESGAGAVVHAAWKMERTTQTTVTIPVADLLKTTVDKPLNGGRTELKISAVRKESTLEVTLQLHDKAPRDAGVPPSFPIDASMTRVELGSESQEKFNPETGLTREIEVFENGRIVARFKQNGGIADLNNKWITITLPELLLQGAYQTQGKGISVPTFDQDSVE